MEKYLESVKRAFRSLTGQPQTEQADTERHVPSSAHALRAAVFTRPEISDKGEVVSSAESQEERCRTYIRKRGYHVVDVFHDRSESSEAGRSELQRLRTSMWKRQLDVVVMTEPNRLFSDVNRLVRFAKEADTLDISIEFVDIDIDLSMLDEM